MYSTVWWNKCLVNFSQVLLVAGVKFSILADFPFNCFYQAFRNDVSNYTYDLYISPFRSISFYFTYFEMQLFGAYTFQIFRPWWATLSQWNVPLCPSEFLFGYVMRLWILSKCSTLAGFFWLLWPGKGKHHLILANWRWKSRFSTQSPVTPEGGAPHPCWAGQETQVPTSLPPRVLSRSGSSSALPLVPTQLS